jgi:hypothetical protein
MGTFRSKKSRHHRRSRRCYPFCRGFGLDHIACVRYIVLVLVICSWNVYCIKTRITARCNCIHHVTLCCCTTPYYGALAFPTVIIACKVSRGTFSVKQENRIDITAIRSMHMADSQFMAFVECSGNRQNLEIIALTTHSSSYYMFSKTLHRTFISPVNISVYVDEFNDKVLNKLPGDVSQTNFAHKTT